MRRGSSGPSPSLVISIIALVFAMAGTGLAAKSTIDGKQIKNGSITASKLAPNSVTSAKLAANAVVSTKLAPNAVVSTKLAPNAVVSTKVAANAITADKVAANAVTGDKIASNAVVSGKVAPNAITADKIAANAVVPNGYRMLVIPEQSAKAPGAGSATRSATPRSVAPYGTAVVCAGGMIAYGSPCPVPIVPASASIDVPAGAAVQRFFAFPSGGSTATLVAGGQSVEPFVQVVAPKTTFRLEDLKAKIVDPPESKWPSLVVVSFVVNGQPDPTLGCTITAGIGQPNECSVTGERELTTADSFTVMVQVSSTNIGDPTWDPFRLSLAYGTLPLPASR